MKTIQVLTEKEGHIVSVKSPVVGIYDQMPRLHSLVTEHSDLGRITNLRTGYRLVFPSPIQGKVIQLAHPDKMVRVAYGQELFQVETKIKAVTSKKETPAETGGSNQINEDDHTIRAFTTGIFYQNPSPDDPPFVTKGQIVQKGKVLGLIEVMKTFNQIIFQGIEGNQSPNWIVTEIIPQNGEEVKLGDPLFLLEETSRQP